MSIKGWTTAEKLERLSLEYSTQEPIRLQQSGQSVLAHQFVRVVGTDAVEANSTTDTINATTHVAQRGDVIRFTSGALSGVEVKVWSVTANAIVVGETLPSAPAAAVTFQILRHKYPVVTEDGLLSISGTIEAAGLATEAKQDAQIVQLGQIEAAVETLAAIDFATGADIAAIVTALAGTLTIDGVVSVDNFPAGLATEATLASLEGKDFATQTTLAAWAAEDFATEVTLAAAAADLALLEAKDFATEDTLGDVLAALLAGINVDVVSALPAGNNNIGDVDVASLPALPTGSNTIGNVNVNGLTVVDLCDTPWIVGSSINGSAGAFYQAVASLAANVKAIQCLDTMGKWVGVYTGAALSEVLVAVIPPGSGGHQLPITIASGTRVALRSLELAGGSADDNFAINFLG